jgi:hypothetical protein
MLVAAREIDDAETEQEFFVLVNKHAKYFYLEKLKTGENSVERRDQTTLYSIFSNEEGMFVIGDSVYRVMGNGVLVHTNLKNKTRLTLLTDIEVETLEINSEFCAFNYLNSYPDKEFYGLVDTLRGDRLYDPTNWKNDRWVKIKVMAYYQLNTGTDYYGIVQIEVYGQKKNMWGNWVPYETINMHRNVSYELMYQKVGGSSTWHPNSSSFQNMESDDEELRFYTYKYFDDDIRFTPGFQPAPGFYFVSLFAEGSHRGMNNNWAQINY